MQPDDNIPTAASATCSGTPRTRSPEQNNALVEAALEYTSLRWPILPVYEPGDEGACSCGLRDCSHSAKHPRTRHGVHDATTDEATIRSLWASHPNANVAIAAGSVSGLAVLDVDGEEGLKSLRRLEAEHVPLPQTLISKTGGGGRHVYFRCPVGPFKSRTRIAPGLDIRANGTYVVAPPSRHSSGEAYAWLNGGPGQQPLAPMPPWLIALAMERQSSTSTDTEQEFFCEGVRNDELTRLGGLLRRQGLGEGAIREDLLAFNQRRCRPPLPEAEVRKIACSVSRYTPAGEPMRIHFGAAREGVPAREPHTPLSAHDLSDRGICSYKDLQGLAAVRKPDLVDGLIHERSVNMIVGDSGLGKTPLGVQLGVCVASGRPFLGHAARQGTVLYCDAESGVEDLVAMLPAISKVVGVAFPPEDFRLWSPNFDLTSVDT